MTSSAFDSLFARAPIMAILRGMGVERSLRLADRAWDLGIDSVELPLQTSEDERALRAVAERARVRGKSVGAGTIVSPAQIPIARGAGATYFVSPGFDPAIVAAAQEAGVPILPGVATASEVQRAAASGLTWLKAFPAQSLGASWFGHMRGPFPDVRFVATGGMDAHNAGDFLTAGASVIAVGSALEDERQLTLLADLVVALGRHPSSLDRDEKLKYSHTTFYGGAVR